MASTTVMNLAVAPRVRRATAPKSRVVCAAAAPKQASMKGAAFLSAAALGLILATAQPAFANVCASNPTACVKANATVTNAAKPTAAVAGDASSELNGALILTVVALGSFESSRLVEGRKAQGLDSYLK